MELWGSLKSFGIYPVKETTQSFFPVTATGVLSEPMLCVTIHDWSHINQYLASIVQMVTWCI